MLDSESIILVEIMSAVIPKDFRFPDPEYTGRTNPLVHIKRFNDITEVQGLSQVQRYMVFLLTLEGRACEWYMRLSQGSIRAFEQMCQSLQSNFRE